MRFSYFGLGVFAWSLGVLVPIHSFAQTAPNDPRIDRGGARNLQTSSANINSVTELNCATSEAEISSIFANAPSDQNNFLISSINLLDQDGAQVDRKKFKFLYNTLEAYTGRQADLRSLQAIAVKAQCTLRGKGHLLSAIRVPPQSFERAGADIDLTVVLGKIVNIDYKYGGNSVSGNLDAATLKPAERRAISRVKSRFARLMAPGHEADIDLERAVLLATRIPGINVRPTLQKADGMGVGAVNLVVDIFEFDQYQGDLTILNYSPETLQRWGPLLQVISNSQLIGGDKLKLSAYSSIDFKTQSVFRGSYEVPIMDSDWRLNLTGSYGQSSPGQGLANINLATESVVFGAEIQYPLFVRPAMQTNIYSGIEVAKQTLDVVGTRISNDELSIAYIGAEGLMAWKNMISTYSLEVRQGLSGVFGESVKGDTDLSRIGANPQALVSRFDLDTNVRLFDKFRIHSRALGQYAKDPLLAYEEFAVGNFTVGRGYEPGQLSGDSGLGGSFELVFGPTNSGMLPGMSIEAFAFYDAVKVWNRDQFSEASRFVDSQGFGVNVDVTEKLSVGVTFAHAGKKAFSFSQEPPGETLLVRSTLKF